MAKTRRNQKKRGNRRRTVKRGGGGCFSGLGLCSGNKSVQVAPFESDEEQATRLLSELASAEQDVDAKQDEINEISQQLREKGLSKEEKEELKAQREILRGERKQLSATEEKISKEMSELEQRLSTKVDKLMANGKILEVKPIQDLQQSVLQALLNHQSKKTNRASKIMSAPLIGGGGCLPGLFGKCMGNGTNAVAPNAPPPPPPDPCAHVISLFQIIQQNIIKIQTAVQDWNTYRQRGGVRRAEVQQAGRDPLQDFELKNILAKINFEKKKIIFALLSIRKIFGDSNAGLYIQSRIQAVRHCLYTPERMAIYTQVDNVLNSITADLNFNRRDLIQKIRQYIQAILANNPANPPVRRGQIAPAPPNEAVNAAVAEIPQNDAEAEVVNENRNEGNEGQLGGRRRRTQRKHSRRFSRR